MQTAGSSYAWLKNQICTLEKAAAAELGLNPYELINAELEKSPPGANGLIFLPYLLGERTPRWNPDAKGALIGLTLEHTRADVIRAVIEGVTLNLSIILDIFREKLPIERITVIGGGAKGAVWRRIMADVYQAEILKPDYLEEATSMGAAIIGGVGCGVFTELRGRRPLHPGDGAHPPGPGPGGRLSPGQRPVERQLRGAGAAVRPLRQESLTRRAR